MQTQIFLFGQVFVERSQSNDHRGSRRMLPSGCWGVSGSKLRALSSSGTWRMRSGGSWKSCMRGTICFARSKPFRNSGLGEPDKNLPSRRFSSVLVSSFGCFGCRLTSDWAELDGAPLKKWAQSHQLEELLLGLTRTLPLFGRRFLVSNSFLLLVVRPGAPSSVLAPSSDALCS